MTCHVRVSVHPSAPMAAKPHPHTLARAADPRSIRAPRDPGQLRKKPVWHPQAPAGCRIVAPLAGKNKLHVVRERPERPPIVWQIDMSQTMSTCLYIGLPGGSPPPTLSCCPDPGCALRRAIAIRLIVTRPSG